MIRYHVFYERTNGLVNCLDVYANNVGEAFEKAKKIFKDHLYPVKGILGVSKKENYLIK